MQVILQNSCLPFFRTICISAIEHSQCCKIWRIDDVCADDLLLISLKLIFMMQSVIKSLYNFLWHMEVPS